MFIDV